VDTTGLPKWYKNIVQLEQLGRAILGGDSLPSEVLEAAFSPGLRREREKKRGGETIE
jgi:hypothetical protein